MRNKQEAIIGLIALALWIGSYIGFLATHSGMLWVLMLAGAVVDLIVMVRAVIYRQKLQNKQ